jgi:nitrate reductase gamma subunit
MTETEFLLWVRGTGFTLASGILLFGVLLRLFEILLLGRKTNLAALRASGTGAGLRTIFSRSLPADGATFKHSMLTVVAGYTFHIGLFVVIFLFAPHIQLLESLLGLSWKAAPNALVDFFSVLSMVALMALLWQRISHPVLSFLSRGEDYLVWLATFLPFLTGYLAYHHLLLSYTSMLALHILSVEILMVLLPFTKLSHAFTLFLARWYNGSMAGEKGVTQ